MTTGTTVLPFGNSPKYPWHTNIWVWTFFFFIMWKLTCPGSWLCWSFCFPSSPRSHWWSALSWAAAAGSSAWWPPEKKEQGNGGVKTRSSPMAWWEGMNVPLHAVVTVGSTYLLACCYVDGCVHSSGCSGGTHDQNHFRHPWACRVLTEQLYSEPSLWFDIISSILSIKHKIGR